MNICMLAYTNYDIDNRVRRYAETLQLEGNWVDAIVFRTEDQCKSESINGVNVYRIQKRDFKESSPIDYLIRLIWFFIKSFTIISIKNLRHKYDIIHVHSIPDFEVFAALIPKLMGTKVILDIHDIVPEFYADKFSVSKISLIFKFLVMIERISIKFSNHVIIANHIWENRLISRSVKSYKCTTLLNYPDYKFFVKQKQKMKNEKFIILYPGSLNWHQGLDIAIEAFGLIKKKIQKAEFHIYGVGPEKIGLINLIGELKLNERVFIHDPLPSDKIIEIMAKADLGIVPKRSDSFGNEAFSTKILEFMAVGLPIIASDTDIDKYYFNESLLLFFKAGDVNDLAEKILFLYNNQKLRNQLIINSFEYVKKNDWEKKKNIYFSIIEHLTSKTIN